MSDPGDERIGPSTVSADDVQVRDVRRRTFLKEFGLMAGMAGFVWGCESSDTADTDTGDPIQADADPSDPVIADQDVGDPVDAD